MSGPDWTAKEDAVIARHYPKGGAGACRPFLPRRSERAIRVRAYRMIVYCQARKQAGRARDSKPAPEKPLTPKMRKCLDCRDYFRSEGAHNRVCRQCKSREAWQSSGSSLSAVRW